ncbi:tubulin polyglutamylase complex subunit 2-like, partial [Xenopus laevis]|uniref:Tubulin polyglutamylase complex subunit 2-like n=1 Tax=Xenopus laevis TaxID=8355 RepID=A0A8J1M0C4_XENLA
LEISTYNYRLQMGLSLLIESSPGISEVKFDERTPAKHHLIVSWEQRNSCMLPDDLKNFYLMTDGFHMSWSVKLVDSTVQVRSMRLMCFCLGKM